MPQRAEYMAIEANNTTDLSKKLNQLATQNWKPILMSTSTSGIVTITHVILEHVMGS
jgi:hypothetical protein